MQRRIFLGVLSASLAGARFAQAAIGPITVGVDSDNKPFIFKRDGEFVGFSFDLWEQISKELGITYKLEPMQFSALIPALQTQTIDVAYSSIFITAQRKAVVDFSDPYFLDSSGILVPVGSAIKSVGDLVGKRVVTVTGTAQVKLVKDSVPTVDQTQLPSVSDAYLALQAGRVDAVVYDAPTLAYYAATEGRGKATLLGDRVGNQIPCGFAFPKGSNLVSDVNGALGKLRTDGRYQTLYKKWFGDAPQ